MPWRIKCTAAPHGTGRLEYNGLSYSRPYCVECQRITPWYGVGMSAIHWSNLLTAWNSLYMPPNTMNSEGKFDPWGTWSEFQFSVATTLSIATLGKGLTCENNTVHGRIPFDSEKNPLQQHPWSGLASKLGGVGAAVAAAINPVKIVTYDVTITILKTVNAFHVLVGDFFLICCNKVIKIAYWETTRR